MKALWIMADHFRGDGMGCAGRSPVDETEWFGNAHAETGVCNMPEDDEQTFWAAERTGVCMADNRDRPFSCFASFIRPHSPFNQLKRFLDPYQDAGIEPPAFSRVEWEALPLQVRTQIEVHVLLGPLPNHDPHAVPRESGSDHDILFKNIWIRIFEVREMALQPIVAGVFGC